MEDENKRKYLLIYREMIPSIYLCGHCQMEMLAAQGKVEYRAVQEMKLKNSDLNRAEIILLGRTNSWYEYQLTKRLHEAGKYIIYILDDDLLNIPPELSSARYYRQTEIQEYIRGMIEMSDAIISPSPLLLEKYARDGRRAIQIEEPAINPIEYRPHDPEAPVKIGFAGSIDRIGDLEHIPREALLQIKAQYGNRVRFEFFGAIPSFADKLEAECIPWCNSYDEYRQTLNERGWDIGLAPLAESEFNVCKHYNKFSEYAAAGIVGVFSDVEPYTRLENKYLYGCFCENAVADWHDRICDLTEDYALREQYRKNLCELAAGKLSVNNEADRIFDQELSALKIKKTDEKIHCFLSSMKLGNITRRGTDFVKRKGICAVFGKLQEFGSSLS